jgi:hypothetical protein
MAEEKAIRLVLIDEPPPRTRSILYSDSQCNEPFLEGAYPHATEMECGRCHKTLVVGMLLNQFAPNQAAIKRVPYQDRTITIAAIDGPKRIAAMPWLVFTAALVSDGPVSSEVPFLRDAQ